MSGKPAARVGDKVASNVIVSGSATVLIGDAGQGCADGSCKASPSVGSPVNPMLGIKVLPGETDFALAAPSPFVFTRSYASDDARIGPLGQGWSIPGASLYLEVSETATVMVDPQGRRITFDALAPGQSLFSPSESLWIRRGGPAPGEGAPPPQVWDGRWIGVPATVQRDERCIVAMAVGSPSTFVFAERASRWPLLQVCDRNGYTTTYQWSATGDLRWVQDSAGRMYAFVYQVVCPPTEADRGLRLAGVVLAHDPGRDGPTLASVFEPTAMGLDWLVRFSFDAQGNLVQVRNRMDQPIRYFGWRDHILVRHGEPGGIDVRYTYDAYNPKGRVLTQANADGLSYRFDYYPQHTVVTDSLGRVETFQFEGEAGLRRLVAHERADQTRITYAYDSAGRLVAESDPMGRVTRYRLDGEGMRLGVTRPDGKTRASRFESLTRDLTEVEDELGRIFSIERDKWGRPVNETGPDGASIRYEYADLGLPDRATSIIDPKGGVRKITWNNLGLPKTMTDCSGGMTKFDYSYEGWLIRVTNAFGEVLSHDYDGLGREVVTLFPDGTRLAQTYDNLGRHVETVDALGRVTRNEWDRFGRISKRVDPGTGETNYHHDVAGRLTGLHMRDGRQYLWRYDLLDRKIAEFDPNGHQQLFKYNLAGELIELIDPQGRFTVFERDELGRLVSVQVPGSATVSAQCHKFSYDAAGQLLEASSPEVTVSFAYDTAGRMSSEKQVHVDGWKYQHRHQFDQLGVRKLSRYDGAPDICWMMYGSGHMHGVRVADHGLDFERDALHREIRRSSLVSDMPTGWISRRAFDHMGQITHQWCDQTDFLRADLWKRFYAYDAMGKIVSLEDSRAGLIKYQYDKLDRLQRSWHDGRFTDYADARTQLHLSRSLNGSLVRVRDFRGGELELEYDGWSRLTVVRRLSGSNNSSVLARYFYDPFGRRIRKQVNAGDGTFHTTRFGWDGDRLASEFFDNRCRTLVYEPGGFVPMLRVDAQVEYSTSGDSRELVRQFLNDNNLVADEESLGPVQVTFFQTDSIGTPVALVDPLGKELWGADPDDFKAVHICHATVDQPVRFQGQYFDEETGFYYNFHRYYDPEAGVYLTPDPIGLLGGMDLFAYANGNPVGKVDPKGLDSYMCTAPLHAIKNGLGEGPAKFAHDYVPMAHHQYLCVGTEKSGFSCGGQDQRGDKWYDPINGPGKSSQDSFSPATCKKVESENNCLENCLKGKFSSPRPRYGIPFGTDCQEWADDALDGCQKKCKGIKPPSNQYGRPGGCATPDCLLYMK